MKITSTHDVHQGPLKALIYGESGSGKTTLAGTLPGRTLIVSAESGLLSLKGTNIDVLDITVDDNGNAIAKEQRPDRLREVYVYLMQPEVKAKYDTIFIDSLSEVAQNVLERHQAIQQAETDKGKKPDGFALWGGYTKQFASLVKAFRDIPHYNVVFTCLEELDKDESARRFYAPSVPGNAAKEFIVPAFDIVLRLSVNPDGKRVFTTGVTETVKAKVRGAVLPIHVDANLSEVIKLIREPKKGEEK